MRRTHQRYGTGDWHVRSKIPCGGERPWPAGITPRNTPEVPRVLRKACDRACRIGNGGIVLYNSRRKCRVGCKLQRIDCCSRNRQPRKDEPSSWLLNCTERRSQKNRTRWDTHHCPEMPHRRECAGSTGVFRPYPPVITLVEGETTHRSCRVGERRIINNHARSKRGIRSHLEVVLGSATRSSPSDCESHGQVNGIVGRQELRRNTRRCKRCCECPRRGVIPPDSGGLCCNPPEVRSAILQSAQRERCIRKRGIFYDVPPRKAGIQRHLKSVGRRTWQHPPHKGNCRSLIRSVVRRRCKCRRGNKCIKCPVAGIRSCSCGISPTNTPEISCQVRQWTNRRTRIRHTGKVYHGRPECGIRGNLQIIRCRGRRRTPAQRQRHRLTGSIVGRRSERCHARHG